MGSRGDVGLKSNIGIAQQTVESDNSDDNGTLIERICKYRTPQDELQDFCAHALGRGAGSRRCFTLRVLLWNVLSFSAGAALGDADSRIHLFGEHFLEHQRHFAQLHSQSVFPFAAPQSFIQCPGINHSRLRPDFLRMHSHAASQG